MTRERSNKGHIFVIVIFDLSKTNELSDRALEREGGGTYYFMVFQPIPLSYLQRMIYSDQIKTLFRPERRAIKVTWRLS